MIPQSKWVWHGEAAHFICGRWCRFHMATEIGPFLVSTVGLYVHPRHAQGHEGPEAEWLAAHPDGEEIGSDHFYETMVFRVTGYCHSKDCGCGLPTFDPRELDFAGYKKRRAAREGHIAMCRKWANKPLRVKE